MGKTAFEKDLSVMVLGAVKTAQTAFVLGAIREKNVTGGGIGAVAAVLVSKALENAEIFETLTRIGNGEKISKEAPPKTEKYYTEG